MYPLFLCLICLAASKSHGYLLTGSYEVKQQVLMFDGAEDSVGYQIISSLIVTSKGPDVYLMKLKDPGLHIMSRKAPTPNGFVPHSSPLDDSVNNDFIVELKGGLVTGIHLSDDDSISMRNIKRSLVSALQFNEDMKENKETDTSGVCFVEYKKSKTDVINKIKNNCETSIPNFSSSVWGGSLNFESGAQLTLNGNKISSVTCTETITMGSNLADYAVTKTTASMAVVKKSESGESGSMEYSGSTEDIVANTLIEIGGSYTKYDLTLEKEPDHCTIEKCPELDEVVKDLRSNLKEYGSAKSSSAVLKVANAMRRSNKQQIYKVLNSKDNKKILGILLDIAGSVQTYDSHQAVLKKLKINTDKYDLDNSERYFWALSFYPNPSLNITQDIVQLVKTKHHDKKLFQTILQTGAAMVNKISLLHNDPNHQLMGEIVGAMKEELSNCEADDESCRQQYLNALGQTRSPLALPILIKHTTTSTSKSGVTALKGIEKIGSSHWTPDVFKLAEQVLLSDKGFDSSSRAISLEILVSQELSDTMIKRMLSLLSNRKQKEINQLIIEKLSHKAGKCPMFNARLSNLLKQECNWNKLAQGGLSTSFSRHFMERGFLSTDQEISNGILKRGLVHVNLAHNNTDNTLFTLGLFSTGLGSFMSSNQDSGPEEEEEEATAGMQIQVLGVEFRPFVFFVGSGDLMGHVWSGTASTKTPAYQAALVVSRNEGLIPLGPAGTWADLTLNVAASLELAGLIEISLWNRNANSAVFNRLGLIQSGGIRVYNDFVKSKVDSQLSVEPSLDLTSQIDFSSSVALCLKLYQPSSVIRYNTYKIERIPGSKHKLRKSRYTTRPVPGRTYALNQKNNEMCNAIHQ